MPQIREYTQQLTPQGTPQTRVASGDAFGAGIGEATQQLGAAVGYAGGKINEVQEQQDISEIRAKLAKARADWTVHFKERADAASLGDQTFAEKFNEDLSNYLAETRGSVRTAAGQRFYDQAAGQLQADFIERAGIFQAQSAGLKAKMDYSDALNSHRNALYADPTQFDSVLRESLTALNDPAGPYAKMPAAVREELQRATKQELAISTVQGIIEMSPTLALKQLEGDRWNEYLDADKRAALVNQAQTAIRAEEAEQERMRAVEKREREMRQMEIQNDFVEKLANGQLTTKEVLKAHELDAVGQGSKHWFIEAIKTRNKEFLERPIKTDPTTAVSLFERIHLPDGDPRKITNENELNQAYINRRLSFEDMNRLRKEVQEARTEDGRRLGAVRSAFLAGVKPQIDRSNPLMGKIDQTGAENMYQFSHYAQQQERALREAGKNPYDLYNPASPLYLGKQVASFQKSIQQSIQEQAGRVRQAPSNATAQGTPPEKQRKPGESAADYLKRTGGM